MAAPKLKVNAAPAAQPRVLRSSGVAPTNKLKLKSADGKVIQPKAAAPKLEDSPAPVVDEQAAAAAAAAAEAQAAAEAEAARLAQEEYERQMEEYNRQMEEYNRQLAEAEAAQRAEEEARAKAEEEARIKADAEAKLQAEIQAQLQAEADAKRRAEEEARAKAEEEARIKAEFEARLKAEAEAKLQAELQEKMKAAAEARAEAEMAESTARTLADRVATLTAQAAAETDADRRAALDAELAAATTESAAATAAATAARAEADKAGAEALSLARAAAAMKPSTPAPRPAPTPAPAPKPAAAKPAAPKHGLHKAAVPGAGGAASKFSVAGLPANKLAAPKPKAAPAPAAAEEAPAEAAAAPPHAPKPKAASPLAAGKPKLAPKPVGGAVKLGAKPAAKPAPKPKAAVAVPAPAADAPADPDAPLPENAEAAETPEDAAPELTEEELNARDARIQALTTIAAKPPIWKTPGFLVAVGALLALIVGCGYFIIDKNAQEAKAKAYEDKVNVLLKRAGEINMKGIESLADAQSKNVDIVCSKADAETLLTIVVNPFVKNSRGSNILGGAPKGVAQQACLLLGIAAEKDPSIDKLIFDTLNEECNNPTLTPDLYFWLLQRMALANNKGINKKFKKLAETIAKKDKLKNSENKWKDKNKFLAKTWEVYSLRVTPKDIPLIMSILKDPDCDGQVVTVLANALDTVLRMTDDAAEKAKLGDEVFDTLPDKLRNHMAGSLGQSCSPKALAYYKERANDPKNWQADAIFFGNYYSDDIIPFLQELKPKANGDARKESLIDRCIMSVVGQNRDRSVEDAEKLVSLVFDKINENTSDLINIIDKTDPDGANFIGKDSPEYEKLMARRQDLEKCRNQKISFIHALAGMNEHGWVTHYLDKYAKDSDDEVASEAGRAKEQVKKNTQDSAAQRAMFQGRDKE